MSLIAKGSNSEFKPAPAGNQVAICVYMFDLGIQVGNFGPKPQVYLGWELPQALMDDGRPFVVGRRYNPSLDPKSNLRKDLQSWRGKTFTEDELAGFYLPKVLGAPCMLNLVHEQKGEKTYCNIASISSLPKGMPKPEPTNPLLIYDLDDPNPQAYEALPDWVKDQLSKRVHPYDEAQQSEAAAVGLDNDFDEDIPF